MNKLHRKTLGYRICYHTCLYISQDYSVTRLQLDTENLTLISNIIPRHLFTNISEDFFRQLNWLLFVSRQYVGEGTRENLEIGGKGIERGSTSWLLESLYSIHVIFSHNFGVGSQTLFPYFPWFPERLLLLTNDFYISMTGQSFRLLV